MQVLQLTPQLFYACHTHGHNDLTRFAVGIMGAVAGSWIQSPNVVVLSRGRLVGAAILLKR